MTEEEWLGCKLPKVMLRCPELNCSDRKLRLYCCACIRALPVDFADGSRGCAADVGEGIADGRISKEEQAKAEVAFRADYMNYGDSFASWVYASELTYVAVKLEFLWGFLIATSARDTAEKSRREAMIEEAIALEHLDRLQPILLRDIIGNPFRPVAFDPAWRTDTVTALARTMYESREFSAMPILADALQDTGCDSTDILNHCRSDGPHVRGCWVVDLVLGKA